MSTLEQEIIEKFHQLHPAAKQRVRAVIDQEVISESDIAKTSAFDYTTWFRDVEALREQLRISRGDAPIDVVGMLRDIRDGEDE